MKSFTYLYLTWGIFVFMSCRPDSGPNDYASQEIIPDAAVPIELELEEGEERFSFSVFYEGDFTEQVLIDDITSHFYIYESTFTLSSFSGDRTEGVSSDMITHLGGAWWGGGIHWDEAKDLSEWSTLHLSLQAKANQFTSLELAMNNSDTAQFKINLVDHGWESNGNWQQLEIPLETLIEKGLDLTQVRAPFVLIGGSGEAGEKLLIDAVYLSKN